jgi:hypothetical protein
MANFEILARAYALKAYEGAQFVGWEARPSPRDPDTEALVTCRFTVQGARLIPHSPTQPRICGEQRPVIWISSGV